jgi:hypothetical protein
MKVAGEVRRSYRVDEGQMPSVPALRGPRTKPQRWRLGRSPAPVTLPLRRSPFGTEPLHWATRHATLFRSKSRSESEAGMSDDPHQESRPFRSLEDEFQMACDAAVNECKVLIPDYNPTGWIGMSRNLGATEAARRLVVKGDIQTGFERLVSAGHPELTIEWAILSPRWEPLFSEQHREAARWRLRQAGIEPPH